MKITDNNGIVKWIDEIPEKQIRLYGNDKNDAYKLLDIENIDYKLKDDILYIDIFAKVNRLLDEIPIHFSLKKVNLLPKESTMRTRYAVVNLKDKVEFEKKWEMPYGYNNCPYIGYSQQEAIEWLNKNLGSIERKDYVVERHNAGMIEPVWKPNPEKEEDDWDEEF